MEIGRLEIPIRKLETRQIEHGTDSSSSSDSVFFKVASVDDYGGGVAMRIILVMWVVRAMATLVMIAFSVFTER